MILHGIISIFRAVLVVYFVLLTYVIYKAVVRKNLIVRLTVMPKTIQVGQTATAVLKATGTDGNPFKLTSADQVALLAGTAQDVTIGTPVFMDDGSVEILLTGVNPDASDPITATVDGVTSNADTLTIEAAAVTVASVNLTLQ
jgi:pyruvate kinase